MRTYLEFAFQQKKKLRYPINTRYTPKKIKKNAICKIFVMPDRILCPLAKSEGLSDGCAIRFYTSKADDLAGEAGHLEGVGNQGNAVFGRMEELCSLLAQDKKRSRTAPAVDAWEKRRS
jgi:hypothetical protein